MKNSAAKGDAAELSVQDAIAVQLKAPPGVGLTPLWEQVTRTGHIPADTDVSLVFSEISARLRHGEWEVRQHALRVLSEVLPVMGQARLDRCLPSVLSELITNLGHPSAAVRRAASHALRTSVRASEAPDAVLRTVVARANSDDRSVALGVVVHLPALLDDRLSSQTISIMVGTVAKKLIQISFQEHALRSLVRIRQTIGEREFNHIMARCSPQCLQDFTLLCQVYEVADQPPGPLDQAPPLGFLSAEFPSSSDDAGVPGPSTSGSSSGSRARSAQRSARAHAPSPGRSSGSVSPRRSKSPSPIRSTPSRPTSSRPTSSRPTSGRSISADRPKSRTASGASSSFSQPSSDFEDDGLFIRNKSASSLRSDRIGTGRRVRFGGESELKTPSPVVLMDMDAGKENVSPRRRRRPSQPEGKPSQIPVRIKTDYGAQVNPVRPRSRSHETPLRTRNENPEPKLETPRPEITVSSPSPSDKSKENAPKTPSPQKPPVAPNTRTNSPPKASRSSSPSKTRSSPPPKSIHNSPPPKATRNASPPKSAGSSSPPKPSSPAKKASPKRRRPSGRGRASPIPNNDGGESLTYSSSEYEREELMKMRQARRNQAEEAPRVASALASLEECEKDASENASWEDHSIVDKSVMEDLRDRDDWRARVRGAQQLKAALRNSGAVERLRAHLPEFLTFLDSMLEDHSPLVVSATLGTYARLAEALGAKLAPHARHICGALCRPAASSRAEVKMEAAHAAKALMQALGPQPVMEALADNVRARNHRHREAALQLVILGLLTFPSSDFDAAEIAQKVLPTLSDSKRRVRQAALECTAVLGQFVHPSALPTHLAAEKLRSKQSLEALNAAVTCRLARKILPVLSSEGLILYSVQVSNAAARGLSGSPFGADIEWILAGSGSTSAGSARSRGQLFSAARRGSSEDSFPEDSRPISSARLKSSKGSRSPSRKRTPGQIGSPIREYQSFQTADLPPEPTPAKIQSGSSQDDTWELVPVGSVMDDQNNSRLPTEGPLWTAELATDPNQAADGQNKPMYLRLLRRQPEQLVNLDKERGYILLPSKQLASALGRSSLDAPTSGPHTSKAPSPAFQQVGKSFPDQSQESRGDVEQPEDRPSPTRVSVSNWSRDRHRMSPLNREQMGSPTSTASSSDNGYASPYHRHGSVRSRSRDQREGNRTEQGSAGSHSRKAGSPNRADERAQQQQHHQQQSASASSSPSKRMINNNHLHQIQSAPMAFDVTDDFQPGFVNSLHGSYEKLESRRSSAQSAARRSRDSALASSVSSVQTPPADGPSQGRYFDPIETPLPYPSKTIRGPYFSDLGLLDTPVEVESTRSAVASAQAQAASPTRNTLGSPQLSGPGSPQRSVQSSPRCSVAASPERSNSPPIRPQASSPIPLQPSQPKSPMDDALRNPMEVPLPIHKDFPVPPVIPTAPVAFTVPNIPMVPKARPPRSVSNQRRGAKSSSLNRMGRHGSAHSSSSSLLDEAPQAPIRRPQDALAMCQVQMGSQEWTTVNRGLKTLSNLVQNHPEVLTHELHLIVTSLVAQIKNLRSQVSRNACMVAGDMAVHLKRALEMECDDLVAPLLLRSADTNKFLRKDCNDALDKVMQNLPPTKTITAVIAQGANHKNAMVRTTASRLLYEQVHRMGADRVMGLSKDIRFKLLKTTANLLTEGSQETRDWAKRSMQCLVAHENFEAQLEQAVAPNIIRAIDKTLKVLKGKLPVKK